MKNKNRQVYLAVPNWETIRNAGGNSFAVTVMEWDYGRYGLKHVGNEIWVPAQRRWERKSLRSVLVNGYGFPYARTVVIQ